MGARETNAAIRGSTLKSRPENVTPIATDFIIPNKSGRFSNILSDKITLDAQPSVTTTNGANIEIDYEQSLATGAEVDLIRIDAVNNNATTSSQLYPIRIDVDTAKIDSGAGLAIVNNGHSDNIYLAVHGKEGVESLPSGIGCDINIHDRNNRGTCYHAWDWSTTDRGLDGPIGLQIRKVNNRDTLHKGIKIVSDQNSIWLDADKSKTTQRVFLVNDGPSQTKQFYVTCSGTIYSADTITAALGFTDSSLTASKPVFTDANKKLSSSGTVPIANGGTNATSFTSNKLVSYNGTSLVTDSDLSFDGSSIDFNLTTCDINCSNQLLLHGDTGNLSCDSDLTVSSGSDLNLSGENINFSSGAGISMYTDNGDVIVGSSASTNIPGEDILFRNGANTSTKASIDSSGVFKAGGYKSSDDSAGITTTITSASLVGKTITIKNGIITGFA